jgi:probable F420-dependent oxidoreductase
LKFGLGLAPFDRWNGYEEMADAVAAADGVGFDYVTLPDHIIVPEGPEQPRSGVVFPDVIPLAAFLAARTTRIRFVMAALVVPLREPVALAKQLATLDQVSGGRIGVVVGSGWLRAEFEALGVGFDDRGDRTDEYLRVLKACWTESRPSFDGRYVSFPPSAVEPKCVQQPHVPLWIGGNGPRPERRAVELGDGWAPLTGTFDERAEAIGRIRARAAAAGRDPDRLAFVGGLAVGPVDAQSARLARGHHVTERDRADEERRRATGASDALEQVAAARAAGFTHLGVGLSWASPGELRDRLSWFAEEVLGRS